MSLDNGRGGVTDKNVVIIQDTLNFQGAACKHTDNGFWWFMAHKERGSNLFYKFLLTADGVQGPSEQSIGRDFTIRGSGSGQACFSPDGSMYAYYDRDIHLMVFDFGRSTGMLSDERLVTVNFEVRFGGVAFSPSGQFVYVSSDMKVYQYDVTAANLKDSEILVAEYDGYLSDGLSTRFNQMQFGPDCRIYINSPTTIKHLHIIHKPDEKGLACNIEQHGVELPTRHFVSLPNFPNYRLGTG